jgi:hypothetical protein
MKERNEDMLHSTDIIFKNNTSLERRIHKFGNFFNYETIIVENVAP